MLIEFSVGNYRSFKDVVTFSMVAANITARHKVLDDTNVFKAKKNLNLLKSAVFYGANASGKSNLIKAIIFMKYMVLNSSRDTVASEPIEIDNFRLSMETEEEPSHFELVFLLDDIQYRYGFEIMNGRVYSEWLYRTKQREVLLFERNEQEISLSTAFREGKQFTKNTRRNALFLSVVAQWNGEIAQSIVRWFRKIGVISGLNDDRYQVFTIKQVMEGSGIKEKIIDFVCRLDTGISGIDAKTIDISESQLPQDMPPELKKLLLDSNEVFTVVTMHPKYDKNGKQGGMERFDLKGNESDGTQKIFSMAGPIMDSLQNGKILVVDELDARLHPLITREIVKLFNSPITNSHNAQLIFATHDTNLLSNKFFRRDQIWFTEKDRYGATDLYSLVEFKMKGEKVRNDASFEKDYILGRYGAIPFIGNLEELFGEPNA